MEISPGLGFVPPPTKATSVTLLKWTVLIFSMLLGHMVYSYYLGTLKKITLMKRLLLLVTICISSVSFGQTNNYSVDFDGVDDYIDNGPFVLNMPQTYTLIGYIKFGMLNPSTFTYIYSQATNGEIQMHQSPAGEVKSWTKLNNGGSVSVGLPVTNTNEWHLVACIYDNINKVVKIYVDGTVNQVTIPNGVSVQNFSGPALFGRQSNANANFWNGKIDNFTTWDFAWDEADLDTLGCPNFDGTEQGLIGFWNFEEGTGTTAGDLTANGNDGTLNGGTTWSTDVPPYNCCTPDPITTQPTDVTVPLNGTGMFSTTTSVASPTYQWQMDNGTGYMDLTNAGQFSGVDSDMLTVSNVTLGQNNTLFRCIVTENSNCSDTTDVAVLTVEDNTGLNELNQQISIYPNPTSTSFIISSESSINSSFKLFDIRGKVVLTGKIESTEETVDISKLSKGQYNLVFEDESISPISIIKN